jgi:hypothetical protein
MSEFVPPAAPQRACPVCEAPDAFVEPLREGDEYYVECVNCRVYRASRRAFRHFEYLRWRRDPHGLAKLARLAAALRAPQRNPMVRLEYDTWEDLLDSGDAGTPPA